MAMGVDAHGEEVLRFQRAARDVGRMGLLEDLIMKMFESGAWRHYHTAIGEERWRACEFDYFLISSDIGYDDARRVYQWKDRGRALAAATMSDDPAKRRSLADAAAAWHSPGPESFQARAVRLGWTTAAGPVRSPTPARAATYVRYGVTADEHARRTRARAVETRCETLDAIVAALLRRVSNDTELRYVVDQLRSYLAKRGRPKSNREQWARDVKKHNGEVEALMQYWGLHRRGTYKRISALKSRLNWTERLRPVKRKAS